MSGSGHPQGGDQPTLLNVAATSTWTQALGPGTRAALWVQGCPLRCDGCIAPEWIPFTPARAATPREIATELLTHPAVTGFTFSGGEPMLQAAGLLDVIQIARRERELSLICFTGFRLERLRSHPPSPGVAGLLTEIDVLIDGPYVARLNNGRGLRGSTNQRVHFLSDRLRGVDYDFEGRARQVEVRLQDETIFLAGVPPSGFPADLEAALQRTNGVMPVMRPGKGTAQ